MTYLRQRPHELGFARSRAHEDRASRAHYSPRHRRSQFAHRKENRVWKLISATLTTLNREGEQAAGLQSCRKPAYQHTTTPQISRQGFGGGGPANAAEASQLPAVGPAFEEVTGIQKEEKKSREDSAREESERRRSD